MSAGLILFTLADHMVSPKFNETGMWIKIKETAKSSQNNFSVYTISLL